jgi:tRNA (guanine10-N2)-dimethyltransferase
VYVLELAGDADRFARREAAAVAGEVRPFGSGVVLARGLEVTRVRDLAYTRRASELVGYTGGSIREARTLFDAASIDRTGTVAVRARDVRGETGIDTQRAERELGTALVERGFEIDLDAPDHELRAVFAASPAGNDGDPAGSIETTGPRCALGWFTVASTRGFGARAPTKKPFFQPGSMAPLLARALVTIAGARPGATVVDPMCGTGGLLVEAHHVGATVIGLDAQSKMVRGTRTNLAHYAESAPTEERADDGFAVLQGDVTRVPLRDDVVDGVCFDAPYGRQSKIEGDLGDLLSGALEEAQRLAPRAVVVADRPWRDRIADTGWTVESRFERRVHRSLTRYITVLDRL